MCPQAVTHVLIPIIILQLFRDYVVKNKKAFPLHYVLIGGIAGLLPDIDLAIYWVLYYFGFIFEEVHRTFTHTLFLPLIFLIMGFVFWKFKSEKLGERHLKLRNIFFVIAAGSFIHLVLDATLAGTIMPLYPLLNFQIGVNLVGLLPIQFQATFIPALDAILLVLWLIYLEVKHKISSFL